jgi:hypothetical protein
MTWINYDSSSDGVAAPSASVPASVPEPRERSAADLVVLNTPGPLYGLGIGGCCLACHRVFSVSLSALIKERGGNARAVGMRPRRPGRRRCSMSAPSRCIGCLRKQHQCEAG